MAGSSFAQIKDDAAGVEQLLSALVRDAHDLSDVPHGELGVCEAASRLVRCISARSRLAWAMASRAVWGISGKTSISIVSSGTPARYAIASRISSSTWSRRRVWLTAPTSGASSAHHPVRVRSAVTR